MNKQLIKEAEMEIRKKANAIYQSLNPDATDDFTKTNIKQAEHLVDMADELESLTETTSINSFVKFLENDTNNATDAKLLKLYGKQFTLNFDGQTAQFNFDAVSYNAIINALTTIQKEL